MRLKIAWITDPLDDLKIYKDSSVAMMQAADAAGHSLFAMEVGDLSVVKGQVFARVSPLTLRLTAEDHGGAALKQRYDSGFAWYDLGDETSTPLNAFDAVVMRKDPPFDMEYVYTTYLLELAQKQGARIFNRPESIRNQNEKFSITEFPELTPPTLVTRHSDDVRAFLQEHQHLVLKPLDGMGGSMIFVVKEGDANLSVILETMMGVSRGTGRTVMVQRYVPEIREGDKRILLIDGEPVPFALARVPLAGESRGNLAAGGRGIAQNLSARDLDIARSVGRKLRDRGLLLVGLDVIGDYLTEINVTSPTCFREIMDQTGHDVAGQFVRAIESACAAMAG